MIKMFSDNLTKPKSRIGKPKFAETLTVPMLQANSVWYKLIHKSLKLGFIFSMLAFLGFQNLYAQTETIRTGSFIINMGNTNTASANDDLKPYGMILDLMLNYNVPVRWVINQSKLKDGTDFVHDGVTYKGGTFIIPREYRTIPVNNRITYWQGQGVVGNTTTTPFSVNVTYVLNSPPHWVLNSENTAIILSYFTAAGITTALFPSIISYKYASALDCCDDIFAMPHADPLWSTHNRLLTWNNECKGAIYASCHAVSVLENLVNPADRTQQTNFLVQKDPAYTGTSGDYANSNTLILFDDHDDGSIPYTILRPTDPIAQFMGTPELSMLNGSEQVYMPRQRYGAGTIARWNPGAKILVYDPTQADVPTLNSDLSNAAVLMVYGRGFDDDDNGWVMYEAAHTLLKGTTSDGPAIRAFYNFSFFAQIERAPQVPSNEIEGLPPYGYYQSGEELNLSVTAVSGLPTTSIYSYTWRVSVDYGEYTTEGFEPNFSTEASSTVYTVPYTPNIAEGKVSPAVISVIVTDNCGRTSTLSVPVNFIPNPLPPLPVDDEYAIPGECQPGQPLTFNVMENDADSQESQISFYSLNQATATTLPAGNVTWINNGGGSITVVPDVNYSGVATIEYTISNEFDSVASATITVTIGDIDADGCLSNQYWGVNEYNLITLENLVSSTTPPGALSTGTQLDDYESAYQNGTYLNFQTAYTNNIILAVGSEQALAERDIVMLYTRTQTGSGTISIEIGQSSSGPWTDAQTFTINGTASIKNYTIPTGVTDITHIRISAGNITTPANSANNVYLSAVRYYDYDCVSRAPRATNDNITILEDLPTVISVTANDYDPNGLPFHLTTIATNPTHGMVSINNNGTITYVNTTDYSGTDSFSYEVCNDSNYCSTATVYVDIVDDGCSGGYYKPTTTGGTVTKVFQYGFTGTNAATANSTQTNFRDSFIKQDKPTENKGASATLEVGKKNTGPGPKAERALFYFNVSEIPSGSVVQTATFSALRTAGDAVSQVINLHQVTETWTESRVTWNLAYQGHNWTSAGGTFGSVLSSTTVLANGSYYWDAKNTVQSWVSGSSSNYGLLLKTGETVDKKHVFASKENGTVANRPSLTVTYVVPASCEAIPNRNPLANPDYSETYSSAADTIAVLDNDTDPDGNSISISGIGTVTHGSAVISGNNIIFTPTYGYNGIGTVIYTIKDNGSGELTDQSTIYIQIINSPTVAIYDVDSVDSNDELIIYVMDNDEDPEGENTTVSQIITQPTNGTVEISGSTLVFNPYPNFTGRDSLVYEVCETYVEECDATTLCDTAIVYITINNRPPEIVPPLIDTVVPCFCSVINLHNYVSDPEEGTLTFTIVSGPTLPGGGKAGSGTLENNGDGTVSYTPPIPLDDLEYITFTFAVSDDGNPTKISDTVEVTFRIVPKDNTAPVAADDDWLDAVMNTDANVSISDNDYDPDGNPLSIPLLITQPLNGTAEVLPNGLLRYTPDYQFYGTDSLYYEIHDTITPSSQTCKNERGLTDVAKVRITINYDPDQFLPVSLVLYEAKCNNGITEIDWATVSESNNDYFVIERSKDLVSFEEIARVNGQGNSNEYKFYRYFDRNAASGTNYYRLKQVDYNGRLTTYTTVNSSCSSSVSGELMALVYPNPFNTQLNVSIENVFEGEVVIEMFDVAGRKLFGLNEYNDSEIYFRELNIDNLVTGMYYLRIHINGQIITKKLEKK